MSFYQGRKIEVSTKCQNKKCNKDIIWYYLFRQPMNSNLRCNSIQIKENISSSSINILEERNNEIDVSIEYRCRFCDELHKMFRTITKKNGELALK